MGTQTSCCCCFCREVHQGLRAADVGKEGERKEAAGYAFFTASGGGKNNKGEILGK